ncbi:MAG: laccase domain-containing protein, partial [Spiribacter sp.]|nr:laccase domain-containing protein [Spiribacter sp.]
MSGVGRVGECIQILRPDWTISGVNAGFTQRTGGVSHAPYESLNLALHVGDHPDHVHEN